jgi:hypothetical protein
MTMDSIVYEAIRKHDVEHGRTIEPAELLAQLQRSHPGIPRTAFLDAASRMYRRRADEQMREADELAGFMRERKANCG